MKESKLTLRDFMWSADYLEASAVSSKMDNTVFFEFKCQINDGSYARPVKIDKESAQSLVKFLLENLEHYG